MAKIVIIGCGIGGLAFTLKYKGNAEIEIYEARDRSDLGYPWYDTIKLSSFTDNGFDIPTFALEKKKRFYMTMPDSKGKIVQKKKIEISRAEINRIDFIDYLLSLAEEKAKIYFKNGVSSLYFVDNRVAGVVLNNGRIVKADFVIDASGGFSRIRSELPLDVFDYQPQNSETMYYYRACFMANDDVEPPEYDSVYLKSMGENALSWLRTAPNGNLDVFIGHMGELSDKFIDKVLTDLRKRDLRLTNKSYFVRRGKLALRYPLSQIVFDNLALVGDSAYMSMPMTGSGMDNAIFAGVILSDVVSDIKNDDYSIKSLWKYQYKYFRLLGCNMYIADIILKYGMTLEEKDVFWFFDEIVGGEISVKDLQRKIKGVVERKALTASGVKLVSRIIKGWSIARLVPIIYDENVVQNWQKRYNDLIKNGE